ncbi:aldehyde dehydrogenase [Flagellimonas flava]|uniref:aldehyde dehydrogenase n=1 Tax=Flagellimonas flava TaxID=570519 RepID=UPI003D655C2C
MDILNLHHEFFSTQKSKDVSFRKKALKRLEKEIVKREDEICEALYTDFKKPRFETLVAETQFVLAEIKTALNNLELWARPERVSSILANWPSTDYLYREPYGTVLLIAPWNYPFQLVFAPLVGAVAAGNTVVIKPSELTPNTSKICAEIVAAVFEPGHVSVVEGGVEISQKLLDQKWDYIFFTGSTKVGRIVYESAAKHLTPVTLELGGKNPCIVDSSASIKLAAKRIAWGKFLNAGQTCIAPDYVLVHISVKAKLITALQKCIEQGFGNFEHPSNDLARIVNEKNYTRLKNLLHEQEVIFGGFFKDGDNYLSPTLINEPALDSPIMQDEIFGPILPILGYETDDDIAEVLKRYEKPLATYMFSNKKSFQKKMLKKYSFGGGAINDTVIQITNKKLPFGGVGASGLGGYHGKASFEIFSNAKGIIKKANWLDIPLRYPPYKLPMGIVKKIKHLF